MSSKSSTTDCVAIKKRRAARLQYLAGNSPLPPAKKYFVGSRSKYDPQAEDAKRGFRQ